MKSLLKYTTILVILVLLFSCQSKKDIIGKWEIADIQSIDTTDNMGVGLGFVVLAMSNFSHFEFTESNEINYLDDKDSIIAKGKYLFSEDGRELLVKGKNIDDVCSINIQSESEITFENEDIVMKLKRKQ